MFLTRGCSDLSFLTCSVIHAPTPSSVHPPIQQAPGDPATGASPAARSLPSRWWDTDNEQENPQDRARLVMCKKQGDLKGQLESGGRDSFSEVTSRNLKELAIWKNGEQYSGRGNSKCKDCGENEPEVFKEWKVMGAAEQRAGVGRGDGDEGRAWGRVAGRAKAHTALQARDKEFFWVGWEILEFRQKSTLFDRSLSSHYG